MFKINESQIQKSSDSKRIRNDVRKLAIYYCQHFGDMPHNKIADTFELTHTSSVFQLIYDAKILIETGIAIS